MLDALLAFGLLAPLLVQVALGCKCQTSLSTCDETASSDIVFIGTVESIEPKILSRWNLASTSSLRELNQAYLDAQENTSPARLEKLKAMFLQKFPDLPAEGKDQASKAKTTQEVTAAFSTALGQGMRVRFHIRTLFKYEDSDDDEAEETEISVWNPFGGCGFDFQSGETYLVYAKSEESSDYIFTSTCTRTRRLSDAGEDLAYLAFYKNSQEPSARLEGFTTSEANSQSDFDPLHVPQSLKSPVPNALIELTSDALARYTQSDANGRFLFDGLPAGDYRISAFTDGYPIYKQLLAGPKPLQIKEKSCAHQVLFIPASRPN